MASLVATDAFEPPAELTLQRATKQQLGLEFFDSLADSQLTHLSTARLGYAMRNWECQAVRNAEREAPGDQFFRLVDERGQSDDYPHPGLDRWLIDLFLEITDDSRKSGEVLGEMPGATASLRYEAIELMAADYPEIDKTEWTRLLLCGYLLHRAAEARPILG